MRSASSSVKDFQGLESRGRIHKESLIPACVVADQPLCPSCGNRLRFRRVTPRGQNCRPMAARSAVDESRQRASPSWRRALLRFSSSHRGRSSHATIRSPCFVAPGANVAPRASGFLPQSFGMDGLKEPPLYSGCASVAFRASVACRLGHLLPAMPPTAISRRARQCGSFKGLDKTANAGR